MVLPVLAKRKGYILIPGLIAYTAYYNHRRSHQVVENQMPLKALELEGSI